MTIQEMYAEKRLRRQGEKFKKVMFWVGLATISVLFYGGVILLIAKIIELHNYILSI